MLFRSAAKVGENVIITFGFQDNAAFVLEIPNEMMNKMVEEALHAGL